MGSRSGQIDIADGQHDGEPLDGSHTAVQSECLNGGPRDVVVAHA